MNIDKLFNDKEYLNKEIEFFISKKQLRKIESNKELVQSHLKKARHNLEFFKLNKSNIDFNDWLIVTLYYSLYHMALALIINKNYTSKNHYATILILIKEYSITKEEIDLINELSINKKDAQLYTDLKEDRHKASYTTNSIFSEEIINNYESRILDFINKTEDIIQNE